MPLKKRPSTLAQEFIRDLLEVTGGGRARGFEDTRDHAMIRMVTEGVRRMELIQLELPDLSSDLIARPFVRVVPLKKDMQMQRAIQAKRRRGDLY